MFFRSHYLQVSFESQEKLSEKNSETDLNQELKLKKT
jgi:hypothetical protein